NPNSLYASEKRSFSASLWNNNKSTEVTGIEPHPPAPPLANHQSKSPVTEYGSRDTDHAVLRQHFGDELRHMLRHPRSGRQTRRFHPHQMNRSRHVRIPRNHKIR